MRLSLHPRGLAPRIANLAEWRAHLLSRLRRQVELTADPTLTALMREAMSYASESEKLPDKTGEVLVPLRIESAAGMLSFFSTTTVFGTPLEVTLAELAIESFFAADEATAAAVRQI